MTLRSFPLLAMIVASGAFAQPSVDAARYERAASLLPDAVAKLILNYDVTPHWRTGARERFTYRRELGEGRAEFVVVDAATGKRSRAFDAAVIAQGLTRTTGKPIEAEQLPFADYEETPEGIRVVVDAKTWICSTKIPSCRDSGAPAVDPLEVASPDGKWLAFLLGGNLWIRSADEQTRFALTTDGEPHWRYASDPDTLRAIRSFGEFKTPAVNDGRVRTGPPTPPVPPALVWSPDSRRIFTQRIDERAVREVSITQAVPTDGTVRPVTWTWRSAMPNDASLPMAEFWLFDVEARSGRKLALDPVPTPYASAPSLGDVAWSADGREIRLQTRARYAKAISLHLVDADTGTVRTLITETGKTFVESAGLGEKPLHQFLKNGDVLWYSERSGYGHLYLYDGKTGELKRPLTRGAWGVREVLALDEAAGYVYLSGKEREGGDPYYRRVYRVRLADGEVRLLTPEDADHGVRVAQIGPVGGPSSQSLGFSPSGRYFLETYTRVDLPETTVLRHADGTLVTTLETADASRLKPFGLQMPERFTALAADGRTALYGVIWRPSDFDASKRYPLLDAIYPGPQHNRVATGFTANLVDRQGNLAFAQLGTIVVSVDGRGTTERSKTFHDFSYGKLGDPGCLDDHIAVLRELGRRYRWLDLERVGMWGSSGGGYATAHALLTKGDFYKVGVSDAGNHDQRGYIAIWGETYNGPEEGDNYTSAANPLLAAGLKGKLLLLHGDMDANVMPNLTLQLVDALIRANKTFEFEFIPNQGHTTILNPGYALRRTWDFFVQHLIGATPPPLWQFPAPVLQQK